MKIVFAVLLISFSVLVQAETGADLVGIRDKVINDDPRNKGVDIEISIREETLKFCVKDLGPFASQNDVFRVFLQIAAALQEHTYKQVGLCYDNQIRFLLSGEHFNGIGRELGVQNVAYTLRTFPEKLTFPDGTSAFQMYNGGLLYVMGKQMADVNILHRDWYLNDILEKRQADKEAKRPTEFASDDEVF